jgi:hypothetical protein
MISANDRCHATTGGLLRPVRRLVRPALPRSFGWVGALRRPELCATAATPTGAGTAPPTQGPICVTSSAAGRSPETTASPTRPRCPGHGDAREIRCWRSRRRQRDSGPLPPHSAVAFAPWCRRGCGGLPVAGRCAREVCLRSRRSASPDLPLSGVCRNVVMSTSLGVDAPGTDPAPRGRHAASRAWHDQAVNAKTVLPWLLVSLGARSLGSPCWSRCGVRFDAAAGPPSCHGSGVTGCTSGSGWWGQLAGRWPRRRWCCAASSG